MDKQKKEAKMNKKTFINSFLIAFYLVYGTSSVMSRMVRSGQSDSSPVTPPARISTIEEFEAWKSSSPEAKDHVVTFTQYKERADKDKIQKIRLTLEDYNKAENSDKSKILKEYAYMVGEAKFHKQNKGMSKKEKKTVKDYMLLNGETHKSLKKRLKNGPVDLKLTASNQNVTAETQAPSAPSQDQGEKPRKKFLGLF